MDILIVSHFGSTYSENDNDRFLYLAKSLDQKNNVEIVTSSFCHEKKSHRNRTEVSWPFKITFVEEPGYKKNVCLRRFYSHYIFGLNLLLIFRTYGQKHLKWFLMFLLLKILFLNHSK